MTELKFYTDTHLSRQIAVQLRKRGVSVVRCEEVGLAEADDEIHLQYATRGGYTLITFDRGFAARAYRWLAEGRSHGGVFICLDHLQGTGGIGTIVEMCLFYFEAVRQGAADIDEIRDQVLYIR